MRFLFTLACMLWLSAASANLPNADVIRKEGSGPDGDFVLITVRPHGYMLEDQLDGTVHQVLAEGKIIPNRTYVLVWGPYQPTLFDYRGEQSRPLGKIFVNHIHNQCYIDDRLTRYQEYVDHSVEEMECYRRLTLAHLEGKSSLYLVHRIWGDRFESTDYLGYFRYAVLFLTLVALSLPIPFFALAIIGLFRSWLSERWAIQRAVKVLLPLILGVAWFLLLILIQRDHPWHGFMASFRFLLPLGGIFGGLGFLPIMWMADHLYFPENEPPPLWLVFVLYLIAPILIFAAGGAKGASVATSSRTKSGDSSTASAGGGNFGGGGASGKF